MISPLPIDLAEPERHIIVEIIDGLADTTVVHLPASRSNVAGRGGQSFLEYDFAPSHWISVCGVRGSVYVHAGMLENAVVCSACEAAA